MEQFAYTITDENGIHARPAGLLVKEAQKFSSEITLSCGEKSSSLKKLLAVMGLGVKKGDSITVSISGEDEKEAAEALKEFFEAHF